MSSAIGPPSTEARKFYVTEYGKNYAFEFAMFSPSALRIVTYTVAHLDGRAAYTCDPPPCALGGAIACWRRRGGLESVVAIDRVFCGCDEDGSQGRWTGR